MNLGELKAAVRGYSHRSDVDAMLPTFLQIAERRIYYGEANTLPALRASGMLKRVSMATPERPADYLETKMLTQDGDARRVLTFRPLFEIPRLSRAYSWDGARLALSPDQALPVDLLYYARFAQLSADSDTNWLLDTAPNVYLSAVLVELGRWARDEELAAREASNYASAVNSLHSSDKRAQHSGSLLYARPPGVTP